MLSRGDAEHSTRLTGSGFESLAAHSKEKALRESEGPSRTSGRPHLVGPVWKARTGEPACTAAGFRRSEVEAGLPVVDARRCHRVEVLLAEEHERLALQADLGRSSGSKSTRSPSSTWRTLGPVATTSAQASPRATTEAVAGMRMPPPERRSPSLSIETRTRSWSIR